MNLKKVNKIEIKPKMRIRWPGQSSKKRVLEQELFIETDNEYSMLKGDDDIKQLKITYDKDVPESEMSFKPLSLADEETPVMWKRDNDKKRIKVAYNKHT